MEDGGFTVEEWWETVQNRNIGSVEHRVLNRFGSWLMRLNKNSHNFTLFHTILHSISHCAHIYPTQRGLYARVVLTSDQ